LRHECQGYSNYGFCGSVNRFPLEALEELFDGIAHAAAEYKVDVIGGDTSSQKD
jgi:thiamine monophosphate kinase